MRALGAWRNPTEERRVGHGLRGKVMGEDLILQFKKSYPLLGASGTLPIKG